MENVFIDFANWYYSKLKDLSKLNIIKDYTVVTDTIKIGKSEYLIKGDPKKKVLKKLEEDSKKHRIEPALVKDKYKDIELLFDLDTPIPVWIDLAQQFSIFIRYAEKCFMYRNASDIDKDKHFIVYSELLKENNNEVLYIRDNKWDVKIKFTYTQTEIVDIVDNSNLISSYIEKGEAGIEPNKLNFVNVFISREFGKQFCNEFKFLTSDIPSFKTESDAVLMESIRKITAEAISVTFKEIINKNIAVFAGVPGLTMKDIINENYWIKEDQ